MNSSEIQGWIRDRIGNQAILKILLGRGISMSERTFRRYLIAEGDFF
jgi:hypothetical protein